MLFLTETMCIPAYQGFSLRKVIYSIYYIADIATLLILSALLTLVMGEPLRRGGFHAALFTFAKP